MALQHDPLPCGKWYAGGWRGGGCRSGGYFDGPILTTYVSDHFIQGRWGRGQPSEGHEREDSRNSQIQYERHLPMRSNADELQSPYSRRANTREV